MYYILFTFILFLTDTVPINVKDVDFTSIDQMQNFLKKSKNVITIPQDPTATFDLVLKKMTSNELKTVIQLHDKSASIEGNKQKLQRTFKSLINNLTYESSDEESDDIEPPKDLPRYITLSKNVAKRTKLLKTPERMQESSVISHNSVATIGSTNDYTSKKATDTGFSMDLDQFKKKLKTASTSQGKFNSKATSFTLHLRRSHIVGTHKDSYKYVVFVDLEEGNSGKRFWALNERTLTKMLNIGLISEVQDKIKHITNFYIRASTLCNIPLENKRHWKMQCIAVMMEVTEANDRLFDRFVETLMELLQHDLFLDMYEETYKSLGIENTQPYLQRLAQYRKSHTGLAAIKGNLKFKLTDKVPLNTMLLNRDLLTTMTWFYDTTEHPSSWSDDYILVAGTNKF